MAFSDFMRFSMTFKMANDVFDARNFKFELGYVFGYIEGTLNAIASEGKTISQLANRQGELTTSRGDLIGSWSVE